MLAMIAPNATTPPAMTPKALIDEPVNALTASTAAKIIATSATNASTIHVIGHASNAAFNPVCAAVSAIVASVAVPVAIA